MKPISTTTTLFFTFTLLIIPIFCQQNIYCSSPSIIVLNDATTISDYSFTASSNTLPFFTILSCSWLIYSTNQDSSFMISVEANFDPTISVSILDSSNSSTDTINIYNAEPIIVTGRRLQLIYQFPRNSSSSLLTSAVYFHSKVHIVSGNVNTIFGDGYLWILFIVVGGASSFALAILGFIYASLVFDKKNTRPIIIITLFHFIVIVSTIICNVLSMFGVGSYTIYSYAGIAVLLINFCCIVTSATLLDYSSITPKAAYSGYAMSCIKLVFLFVALLALILSPLTHIMTIILYGIYQIYDWRNILYFISLFLFPIVLLLNLTSVIFSLIQLIHKEFLHRPMPNFKLPDFSKYFHRSSRNTQELKPKPSTPVVITSNPHIVIPTTTIEPSSTIFIELDDTPVHFAQLHNLLNRKPVSQWNTSEICQWIKFIGFDKYTSSFIEAKITGKTLLQISSTSHLNKFDIHNKEEQSNFMSSLHCLKHSMDTYLGFKVLYCFGINEVTRLLSLMGYEYYIPNLKTVHANGAFLEWCLKEKINWGEVLRIRNPIHLNNFVTSLKEWKQAFEIDFPLNNFLFDTQYILPHSHLQSKLSVWSVKHVQQWLKKEFPAEIFELLSAKVEQQLITGAVLKNSSWETLLVQLDIPSSFVYIFQQSWLQITGQSMSGYPTTNLESKMATAPFQEMGVNSASAPPFENSQQGYDPYATSVPYGQNLVINSEKVFMDVYDYQPENGGMY